MRVPARVALRVLGRDARGGAVRPAEHDRAAHLPARHVERLGGGVDDLVDRLHGEVERHEFDNRLQAHERGTHAQAGKALLGDRRVDDALGPEFRQQALADLVGALILGDFLAHQEHLVIAPHLLGHRVAQRFAHRRGDGLGVGLFLRRRARRRLGNNRRRRRHGGRRRGCVAQARPRRPRRRLDSALVLALAQDHGDRRVDLHILGAVRHQDLAQRALVDRLDFHRRLVGLDLGQHIAGFDRVAFVLQPLGELALGHCR